MEERRDLMEMATEYFQLVIRPKYGDRKYEAPNSLISLSPSTQVKHSQKKTETNLSIRPVDRFGELMGRVLETAFGLTRSPEEQKRRSFLEIFDDFCVISL